MQSKAKIILGLCALVWALVGWQAKTGQGFVWLQGPTGTPVIAQADASGNLKVSNATQLPSALGPQAPGSSLSVVSGTATFLPGQAVIATTGTAVQLSSVSHVLQSGLVIKAKASNNATGVFVGLSGVTTTYDGTGAGFCLLPGEVMGIGAGVNINTIYFNGTIGDVISFGGAY